MKKLACLLALLAAGPAMAANDVAGLLDSLWQALSRLLAREGGRWLILALYYSLEKPGARLPAEMRGAAHRAEIFALHALRGHA
jgi:hypothetical protein